MTESVTYLGHIIDAQGLHPIKHKVEAIQEAPRPKNLTRLKSYLGLLTYYNRFLPNLYRIFSSPSTGYFIKTHLGLGQVKKNKLFVHLRNCYYIL